ncbi:aldo/keto reductase [Clostridium transplantifaecale]|uniref:aldo/keto reductase n=1 Tax=Clostridium transplantifaecale TaxID=2479838 RepID=UPI000F64136F|nr:aldo/keto reductase [Clostridium transplantifaecale]
MKARTLGKDLTVAAVGLGCMGFSHAYGAATEKSEAVEAIQKAFEIGYTFFDTAESYLGTNTDGSISYNEELVGEALSPYRNKVQLATKFGVRHDNRNILTDSRPETIRSSVEGSLRRLHTDYIDLYYQHRIDPSVPAEEVAGVMADLIREGKITHWGISEANEDYLRKAHAVCPVTAIQNRYSMMYRDYERLFPVLEELGVGFVAFSPMANGFLTGKYTADSKFTQDDYRSAMPQFTADAMQKNQELLALLYGLAESKNATPAQISLAWMLCGKSYIVPIPGTRKISRLTENAGAADIELTADEVRMLNKALDGMELSGVFGGSPMAKK